MFNVKCLTKQNKHFQNIFRKAIFLRNFFGKTIYDSIKTNMISVFLFRHPRNVCEHLGNKQCSEFFINIKTINWKTNSKLI
uniref:Uncharacterized protein n=1 Tax=Meloidogyne enterolobii TaxID=390850 RepID=A0A6V7V740_MELEN|nr:unnamed protein product [Meloidogyne enterolobii]